jgi:hypothetical protein
MSGSSADADPESEGNLQTLQGHYESHIFGKISKEVFQLTASTVLFLKGRPLRLHLHLMKLKQEAIASIAPVEDPVAPQMG